MQLKLNYKKITFIGSAFFSILLLWQVYNTYCPLFLDDLLAEYITDNNRRLYIIGIIMAADNMFALFLLPLFGHLSDKTKTKYGKRMPYIVIGMILAAIAFPFIAVFYVQNSLVGVILMMLIILMIMHMYRTPAVSLMPDVTPKPLRSKANGLINLIGYLGPIIAGAIKMIVAYQNHPILPFIIASAAMISACIILIITINENKLLDEMLEDIRAGEELSQSLEKIMVDKPLSKKDKKNLRIILLATFLWFMSFNAVESFMSLYCRDVLNNESIAGIGVIILTFSSILTFIPSGFIANKLGRKKSVIIGIVLIIIGFIAIGIAAKIVVLFYLAISISGIGWAMINVNSYPMVCEMSHQGNIGKFSGYYYTSSMIAQSVTPIVVGFIMSFLTGLNVLFIYSAIIMSLALIVINNFKENKKIVKELKTGLAVFDND